MNCVAVVVPAPSSCNSQLRLLVSAVYLLVVLFCSFTVMKKEQENKVHTKLVRHSTMPEAKGAIAFKHEPRLLARQQRKPKTRGQYTGSHHEHNGNHEQTETKRVRYRLHRQVAAEVKVKVLSGVIPLEAVCSVHARAKIAVPIIRSQQI